MLGLIKRHGHFQRGLVMMIRLLRIRNKTLSGSSVQRNMGKLRVPSSSNKILHTFLTTFFRADYVSIQQCFAEEVLPVAADICGCIPFWYQGISHAFESNVSECMTFDEEVCFSMMSEGFFEETLTCPR